MARSAVILSTLVASLLAPALADSTYARDASIPSALASPPSHESSAACCSRLESAFPGITYFDRGNTSSQYEGILDTYFNVPAALPPACFIQPVNTNQVSEIVTFISKAQCEFAVKAGGHMLYVGANGIANGVTIDLTQMNQTTLDVKSETVSVGAGARWGEVYKTVEAQGFNLPGAQASEVGVSGLTLGGGISFLIASRGLACDNVKNYEIVLGNGTITSANATHNPDLFKGLKGASGNLGLVTRFDFHVFPSGPLWGGIVTYAGDNLAKAFQPFVDWIDQTPKNPNASIVAFWAHNATSNLTTTDFLIEYTGNATEKPYYDSLSNTSDPNAFPAPLANFSASTLGDPLASSLGVNSLYNLTSELNTPSGLRNIYSGATFTANATVLSAVNAAITEVYASTFASPPYDVLVAEYQPVPYTTIQAGINAGGNVLGLDTYPLGENLMVLMLVAWWSDPAQDAKIQKLLDQTMEAVTTYTQSVGAYRPWEYVNFAYESQDPIGSYGEKNVKFLKNVSAKYDPGQTFQHLAPGGWKLGDAGKRHKNFNFNQFDKSKPAQKV